MYCPHTNRLLKDWEYNQNFLIEPVTKTIYNKNWNPLPYEEDYFLKEYKNQYGKTYIEDENNIRNLARKRLHILKKYIKNHTSLLEIGCATGFFLDEARKYFSTLKGIEISQYATDYAKKKLNLDVQCIDLKSFIHINSIPYDIIATFYVIEHFNFQKEIFVFIRNTLSQNGLWIGSLPSTNGPLFKFDLQNWIKTHPADHYVDYNPAGFKTILELYGFKLIFIKPFSYHKERAKNILKYIPDFFYKKYCDFFNFGDTIEFIAVKS